MRGETRRSWERNGLEKWGERNHCNEISATPAVSFCGRRVPPEGLASLFHRANCYWLINVDGGVFFFFFLHVASIRGIRLCEIEGTFTFAHATRMNLDGSRVCVIPS